jgi:guanylate kinase
MSVNHEGIIAILSSPSGAGKTSLVKEISSKNNFSISISHTTRKPRSNEINGVDYFFVKQEEFKKLIYKKKFLEYAKVFNNFYGSSKDVVFNKLDKGENVIFDIDWQGTEQIKKKKLKYKIITIFILPPSRKELFKRLLNRDLKNEKNAVKRMKQFEKDVVHWKKYDLVVINDNFNKCYDKIIKYINSTKNNVSESYDKNEIRKHVINLIK